MTTLKKKQNFSQSQVIVLESRQAEIMCSAVEKRGGIAISAPSVQELPLTENPEAFAFAEKLLAGQIDAVIFMTGVGTRHLMNVLGEKYPTEEIVKALQNTTNVARGPKPTVVLKEFKIPITISIPEPNTWREILETLDTSEKGITLKNATVAIQEYGVSNEILIQGLKSRGAKIIQVPVYRWALPNDTAPLRNAAKKIVAGEADFVMVTSAVQIRHLFKVAAEEGLEEKLREGFKNVVLGSIGPTATDTIHEYKLQVDFEPSRPKMGHFVSELAAQAEELLNKKRDQSVSHSLSSSDLIGGSMDSLVKPGNDIKITNDKTLRQNSAFLKACRLEKTDYTPVWLMRQAGRYMKEYRDIRAKLPFLELCKRPDVCAEVAITARDRIGADAAILFSDILLIVEPLGMKLQYGSKESPMVSHDMTNAKDIDLLPEIEPADSLSFVFDAVRTTRKHLNAKIPLIGFSGAPFTLASYVIEGGGSKTYLKTKQMMYNDPGAWHALLSKISRGITKYLLGQVEAGVDALQLFDSWVGCLSPEDYKTFVYPHSKSILDALPKDIPVIHFGTNTSTFYDLMRDAGGDVIGVDYRIDLDKAWNIIGHDHAVQGNLDPILLFSSMDQIKAQAKKILRQAAGRPGHIFNLGHGILPETPVENVVELIRFVQEESSK